MDHKVVLVPSKTKPRTPLERVRMPQERLSSTRAPMCHPNKKLASRGLCWTCYDKTLGHRSKPEQLGKIDLKEIATLSGTTIAQAKLAFHTVIRMLKIELLAGRDVQIYGFGSFLIRTRKAFVRGPIRGKAIPVVRFRVAKSIKVALNKETNAD